MEEIKDMEEDYETAVSHKSATVQPTLGLQRAAAAQPTFQRGPRMGRLYYLFQRCQRTDRLYFRFQRGRTDAQSDSKPVPKSASTSSTRRRGCRKRDTSAQVIAASASAHATEGLGYASASAHATEGLSDASASAHATEGLGDASASAHASEGLGDASAHATEGLGDASASASASEGAPGSASASEGSPGSASASEGSPGHVPEEPVGGLPPRPGPEHLLGFLWGVFMELKPDSWAPPGSKTASKTPEFREGFEDEPPPIQVREGLEDEPPLFPMPEGSVGGPPLLPMPEGSVGGLPLLPMPEGSVGGLPLTIATGPSLTLCSEGPLLGAADLLTKGPLLCSDGLVVSQRVPAAVASRCGLCVSVGLQVSGVAADRPGLFVAGPGARQNSVSACLHGTTYWSPA
ncbi:hypothetical protein CRENBAI_014875 [Crenichthys baileyi]|uniref:Uncharacterized protein n=1 Tax=Crenichthys baileyi TaxID=28760 RepID=A0AAV9SBE0_9TELE